MKTESVGQRGKTAEKIVEAILKKFNEKAGFSYFRLADARSAGGRGVAQPGDFCYFSQGKGGILEIKSTEHSFRLPKAAVSQLPILKKLDLAGAQSLVLVLHKGEMLWRVVLPSELEIGPPSWDLRSHPTYLSAQAALESTGWF